MKDGIEVLLGKALSGELGPAEAEALERFLESHPEEADALIRDARFGALLSIALEEGPRFERALRERHRAGRAQAPFVEALRGRARRRKASPAGIVVLAAAAVLLVGLVLLFAPPATRTDHRTTAVAERPPAPPPPEPPPLPEVPPAIPSRPEATPPEAPPPKSVPPVEPPAAKPPAPAPEPPPIAPPPPAPKPVEPGRPTRAAVATVVRAQGAVSLIDGASRSAARSGLVVLAGQALHAEPERGLVEIAFADGSLLRLAPGARVREFSSENGKRVFVESGAVEARIAAQPKDAPFVLDSPRGEARVVGTTLRLVADEQQTRLEVLSGRVRLTRRSDGKSVQVDTGEFAVSAENAPLKAAPLVATRAFQDGQLPWMDYAGTQDAVLFAGQPDRALGAGEALEAGGAALALLVRWDLSELPAGSRVEEAVLSFSLRAHFPKGVSLGVYEMRRPWVEGEATWNEYARGKRWSRPGSRGPGERGTRAVGTVEPTDGHDAVVRLNAAGVALVQSWMRAPSRNYGLIIVAEHGEGVAAFGSREAAEPGRRPKLTVRFTPKNP